MNKTTLSRCGIGQDNNQQDQTHSLSIIILLQVTLVFVMLYCNTEKHCKVCNPGDSNVIEME